MTTAEPTAKQDVKRNFSTTSESSRKGSKFKLELENSDVKKPPVSDIFLKTDLDGLAEFYEASSKWLKIIWLIVIIITTLFLCSELYACVRDFRDNPILTTYSFVADNTGMKFPDIYICPSVQVHRETWKETNVDKNWEKKHVTGIFGAHVNSSELGTVLGLKTTGLESLAYHTAIKDGLCSDPKAGCWTPTDIQEYFLKVGYPVESFLKECSFNGEADCSEPIEIFDSSRGKCFLFKQPEGSRQAVAGVGLSLVLDLDIDNAYPTNDADYESLPKPFADGIFIRADRIFDVGSQQWSLVSPGTYTKMSLQAKKVNLMQREREIGGQTCIKEENGKESLKVFHKENCPYTAGVCQQDCFQQLVWQECGCNMPIDKQFLEEHPKYCTVKELQNCAYPKLHENGEFIEACTVHCGVPCAFWQFKADMSSQAYPPATGMQEDEKETTTAQPGRTTGLFRRKKNRLTPPPAPVRSRTGRGRRDASRSTTTSPTHGRVTKRTGLSWRRRNKTIATPPPVREAANEKSGARIDRSAIIVIDIFFSSLQYIEITQEHSMTRSTFIGNIGGQIGLWVGASIVTIIKFFIILSPFCCYLCRAKKISLKRATEDIRAMQTVHSIRAIGEEEKF